ncbi:hypothetical protein [Bradyrhizobium sp.]|uniref:hypothetical protein n=1 Tax=Bradyrhizobium sp. TaxID=376 RepID=UPI002C6E4E76|nr:hypothetical protein [Bradyrhizobium sp.]HMM91799.1 hypothetical protein [Bradyrhizobium sp.]
MLPTTRLFDRRVPKLSGFAALFVLSLGGLAATSTPSSALNPTPGAALTSQVREASSDVVQARAVVRRGGVAVGPRGNAVGYRSRTVVRGPAVVRPGYAGGGVRWARPAAYGWPRGGAIAAGAAIGMVTAATAAAWAGAAPAPGMCWYYTDPSRTQGFWDYCR